MSAAVFPTLSLEQVLADDLVLSPAFADAPGSLQDVAPPPLLTRLFHGPSNNFLPDVSDFALSFPAARLREPPCYLYSVMENRCSQACLFAGSHRHGRFFMVSTPLPSRPSIEFLECVPLAGFRRFFRRAC